MLGQVLHHWAGEVSQVMNHCTLGHSGRAAQFATLGTQGHIPIRGLRSDRAQAAQYAWCVFARAICLQLDWQCGVVVVWSIVPVQGHPA